MVTLNMVVAGIVAVLSCIASAALAFDENAPVDGLELLQALGASDDVLSFEGDWADEADEDIVSPRDLQAASINALNGYFAGQIIGANPGFCPTKATSCNGDVANIPDYLAAININVDPPIFRGATDNLAPYGGNPGWLQRGTVTFWNTVFRDPQVGDLRLTELTTSPTRIAFKINAVNIKMGITTDFRFGSNILFSTAALKARGGFFNSRLPNSVTMVTQNQDKLFELRKNRLNNNALGGEFYLSLVPKGGPGSASFDEDMPYAVEYFRSGGGEQCFFTFNPGSGAFNFARGIGLSASVSIRIVFRRYNFSVPLDAIFNLAIRFLSATIAASVCSAMLNLDYIRNASGNIIDKVNQPGAYNVALREVYDEVWTYITPGTADTQPKVTFRESVAVATNQALIPVSIDFQTDENYPFLQTGLNDILGSISETPEYIGKNVLVINELVNRLLQNDDGRVVVTDPYNPIEYVRIPAGTFTTTIPGDIANIAIELTGYTLEGLNSFKNDFNVVDLIFGLKYTTFSTFTLDFLNILLSLKVTLTEGDWVRQNDGVAPRSTSFTFDAGLEVDDIFIQTHLTSLINLDELNDKHVGHLLDYPVGGEEAAFNCSFTVVNYAEFASLQFALGQISDPVVSRVGNGLKNTIEDIVSITGKSLKGLLSTKLPAITENLFKPDFNEYLVEAIADLPECWNYQPNFNFPGPSQLIDFEQNFISGATNDLVNRVIGGAPLERSSLDINTLLRDYLVEFEADVDEALGSVSFSVVPDPATGSYIFGPDPLTTVLSQDTRSSFSISEVLLSGADSISRLEVSPRARLEERISLSIGTGNVLVDNGGGPTSEAVPPVQLDFTLSTFVCRYAGLVCDEELANEDIAVQLTFNFEVDAVVHAEVDNRKVMALTFEEILEPTCVLGALDDYYFKSLEVDTTTFLYSVAGAGASASGFDLTTRFGRALADLQSESRSSLPTKQVRYLIQRLAGNVATAVSNSSPLRSAANALIRPGSCIGADYKFVTGDIEGFFDLPDANTDLFVDQPLIETWPDNAVDISIPDNIEIDIPIGKRAFDIRENDIVDSLRKYLTSEGEPTQGEALRVLANSSFFSEYLLLDEETGSIDLDLNLADLLGNYTEDTYVEDFSIIPVRLQIRDVQDVNFALLLPYGDAQFTTKHVLRFGETLNASVTFAIETNGAFVGEAADTLVREDYRLDFAIGGVRVDAITTLAVDLDVLQSLQIDTYVKVNSSQEFSLRDDFFDCALKPTFPNGALLPGFQVTADRIDSANLVKLGSAPSKFFTDATVELIGAAVDAIFEAFRPELADITQGFVREEILQAEISARYELAQAGACDIAQPVPDDMPTFYNFHESEQILLLYEFLDVEIYDVDSPFYINNIIETLLAGVFSGLELGLANIPLEYNSEGFGDFTVLIENIEIRGLETINKVSFLDWRPLASSNPGPNQVYTTRSLVDTGAGANDVEVQFDITIAVDDLFEDRADLEPDENGAIVRVQDDLRFTFTFAKLNILFDLVTKLDVTKMLKIQIQSFLEVSQYPCILEAFDTDGGLAIINFLLEVGEVKAVIECTNVCNSPLLQVLQGSTSRESADINEAITSAVNATVSLLNVYITSDDFAETLASELDTSEFNCIRLNTNEEFALTEESRVARYIGVVGLSGLFAGFVGFAMLVPVHIRRRDDIMKVALLKNAAKGSAAGAQAADFMFAEQKMRSAFNHPVVPRGVKLLIPTLIVLSMVCFVTANFFSTGASVQLKLSVFGDTTKPLDLIAFTLESSIDDMWGAGTYFLALAIAVASGGWPYIKCVLLLFAWFAPATVMGTKRRGGLLEVLDVLGKWSLVDLYVLIILIVGFRFYISSSNIAGVDDLLPADVVVVDVVVTPAWGIYGFVLGVLGLLVTNHVMIYWNRRILATDEMLEEKMLGTYVPESLTNKASMSQHRFAGADERGRIYGFAPSTRLMVGAMLFMSFVLIAGGGLLPLVTFDFKGVAGTLISLIDTDLSSVTYSLTGVAGAITSGTASDAKTRLGILFLQIVYLNFAYIVPLLLLITFAVLWYAPLRLEAQRKILFICLILGAWEALIVFIVSILAAIFQISALAQFIVENSTGTLCANIESFLLNRDVQAIDAKCFDVNASMEVTGWILIAGNVTLIAVTVVLFRLARAVIEDRTAINVRKACINPKDHKLSLFAFILRSSVIPVARIHMQGMTAATIEPTRSFVDSDESPASARVDNPGYDAKSSIDV